MNAKTDKHEFGRSTLELWERGIRRMMDARGQRDSKQFFDLSFECFVADPIAAIREIYAYFDLEYSAAAQDAMRSERSGRGRNGAGEHMYAAEEWGLESSDIRAHFEEYVRTHGLAAER